MEMVPPLLLNGAPPLLAVALVPAGPDWGFTVRLLAAYAGDVSARGTRIASNSARTVRSLTVVSARALDLRYKRFASFDIIIGLPILRCISSTTAPIDREAACRRVAHPRSSRREAPRSTEPRLLVAVSPALAAAVVSSVNHV